MGKIISHKAYYISKCWISHVIYWILHWKWKTEWLYDYRMFISALIFYHHECMADWGLWLAAAARLHKRVSHCILIACVCVWSCFSRVWLFTTPWSVASQAPLSMGFLRQEHWSGLPWPPPEALPDAGIKPVSPALQADYLPLNHLGSLIDSPGRYKIQNSKYGFYWMHNACTTVMLKNW